MCGRIIQSSGPLRYAIVDGPNVRDSRVHNYPPRRNAAPSQELLVIRRNHQTGQASFDPLRWGLIPYWCQDPKGGRKPINAKCKTVRTLRRRCIVPVDGFFEWKAIKGQRAKQPYAIGRISVFAAAPVTHPLQPAFDPDPLHDTLSCHGVCFWPQSLSARSTGPSSRPLAVSRYSARGGCCS